MTDTKLVLSDLSVQAVFVQPQHFDWTYSANIVHEWQLVYPDDQGLQGDVLPSDLEPMTNYIYPIPDLRLDPSEAQTRLIKHSSNCVVVECNNKVVLGLSGGGVDFSWDICRAYMLLGYLPPFYLCALPEITREDDKQVIKACSLSCSYAQSRIDHTTRHLKALEVDHG